MHRTQLFTAPAAVAIVFMLAAQDAPAQMRSLRIIAADSTPIPYATVTIEGGGSRIADDRGMLDLGPREKRDLSLTVRRIGFAPWSGKLSGNDSMRVMTVSLARLATSLAPVTVNGAAVTSIALQGFYRRALDRQKGLGSSTFITPEEIEKRNPVQVTDVLQTVPGVRLIPGGPGTGYVVMGKGGMCPMAVVIDGVRTRSPNEMKAGAPNSFSLMNGGKGNVMTVDRFGRPSEDGAVFLDQFVHATSLMAVEVYPRGTGLPVELEQHSDAACGLIAVWTGPRR